MSNTNEELRKKVFEELGWVSALFMTQDCKGTDIEMPSKDLVVSAERILGLIEAAERRRTEEIMNAIEERAITANKYYEEDNLNHGLRHERNALMMAVKIARDFLTNPER